jgi:hypothetical protein
MKRPALMALLFVLLALPHASNLAPRPSHASPLVASIGIRSLSVEP